MSQACLRLRHRFAELKHEAHLVVAVRVERGQRAQGFGGVVVARNIRADRIFNSFNHRFFVRSAIDGGMDMIGHRLRFIAGPVGGTSSGAATSASVADLWATVKLIGSMRLSEWLGRVSLLG